MINKKTYLGLKKAYNAAVKAKQDTFTFDGKEWMIGYAKYMLEHMENTLKLGKKK